MKQGDLFRRSRADGDDPLNIHCPGILPIFNDILSAE